MNFVTTGYIGTKYVVLIVVLMLLWASYLFLSADDNVELVTTEPASPARDAHLLDGVGQRRDQRAQRHPEHQRGRWARLWRGSA